MEEYSNQTLHVLITDIKEDTGEMKNHLAVQNGRIRKLENWRNYIMGGSIVVNTIIVPIVFYLFFRG